jgi:hypothetical protein
VRNNDFSFSDEKIVKILPDSSNSVLDIIEGVRSMSQQALLFSFLHEGLL